ncbi:MAG: DUF1573 domain-containing protein, partial [Bacteroidota bacterium]
MLRNIFFHLVLFTISFIDVYAQGGIISFEKTYIDLGTVTEREFPIKYRFGYIVAGSTPVTITKIETDCACSIAEYSQEAIGPGKKGFVEVIFSPYKAGPFKKSFTVIATKAVPQKTELIIEGFIKPFTFMPKIEFP